MVGQPQLRLIGAGAIELASEVRAALARLAEDQDDEACFVVTRAGIVWARTNPADPTTLSLCGDANDALCTPRWDPKNRILSFGGRIVKRFGRLSPNQEAILNAFEEEGWPHRIHDPLPPSGETVPKLRLRDAIRWMNKGHECRALRFFGDGTAHGVCWELLASDAELLNGFPAEKLRRAA